MNGEVRVAEDVPGAFSELFVDALAAAPSRRFVLGCSGSSSGHAAIAAAAAREEIDWTRVVVVFADERCVAPGSREANETTIADALGGRLGELAGFHPMRCGDGAASYEELLARLGPIDLLQLGMGSDGHTASLFPGSPGLGAPPERRVVENHDPSGNNPYDRLSLTLGEIARARLVVVTVSGPDKAGAFAAVRAGADLPAARLSSGRLIWLIDPAVADGA